MLLELSAGSPRLETSAGNVAAHPPRIMGRSAMENNRFMVKPEM
jgi:hypothetical protein